jgi:hypothetical protein
MSNLEEEIEALIAIKKRKKRKFTTKPIGLSAKVDSVIGITIEKQQLNKRPFSIVDKKKINEKIFEHKIENKFVNLDQENFKKTTVFITKNNLLNSLIEVGNTHKKWLSYVQIFIRIGGINDTIEAVPENHRLCKFGNWYYDEGQILASLNEFKELEQIHQNMHEYYSKIYSLFSMKIVGNMFSSIKKQESARNKKVNSICKILKAESLLFTSKIHLLEGAIEKLTDDKIFSLSKNLN